MRSIHIAAVVAAIAIVVSCESTTVVKVGYGAALTGARERPAVTTSGTGTFAATVSAGAVLDFTLDFQNLSSNAVRADIRGPVSDTGSADVIIDLNNMPVGLGSGFVPLGGTSGSGFGSINLANNISAGFSADSLRRLMDAGLLYVQIETTADTAGEIRGQIAKQ